MQRVIKKCAIGLLFLGLTAGIGAIEITTHKNQVGVRDAIAQAGSFWDWLIGSKGSGSSRDPLCVLWPSSEDASLYKTSSQTPLFIWKNLVIDAASKPPKFGLVVTRVRVLQPTKRNSKSIIWEQANIDPNQQQIRYGSGASPQSKVQPLTVGQYTLQVFYENQADVKPSQKPIELSLERSFQVVEKPAKSAAMFSSSEAYWRYLAMEGNLRADAIQLMFAEPQPKPDLTDKLNRIRNNPECTIYLKR